MDYKKLKNQAVLRWWLMFTLIIAGSAGIYIKGLADTIYEADITKISFLIFIIFIVYSIKTGLNTYRFSEKDFEIYEEKIDFGEFLAKIFPKLGILGTVIGFIYTLDTTMLSIDTANIVSLKNALLHMSSSIGTALYTTGTGIVCNILLIIQLKNLEMYINKNRMKRSGE